MRTILSTNEQLAQTKAKIGSELWSCCVTGDPVLTRTDMREIKEVARYNLAHGLSGQPQTVYVGKGAHRAALRTLRKEEARLGIK